MVTLLYLHQKMMENFSNHLHRNQLDPKKKPGCVVFWFLSIMDLTGFQSPLVKIWQVKTITNMRLPNRTHLIDCLRGGRNLFKRWTTLAYTLTKSMKQVNSPTALLYARMGKKFYMADINSTCHLPLTCGLRKSPIEQYATLTSHYTSITI